MANSGSWLLLVLFAHFVGSIGGKPPHILFIVADDMGWNDVGYNNPRIPTPVIDRLATEGVTLTQSYVLPMCTPSRSAFMTGYYPFKLGSQHFVWGPKQPACLDTRLTLLPQRLKDVGYNTHMVGKWHLGFCRWECTPTYRGFDSFYGYYNAMEDYYTHDLNGGYDFRSNMSVNTKVNNTYSTHLFANRAIEIIEQHDTDTPLFLYLPFQNVHSPIQAPKEYEKRCSAINDEQRRIFCGMMNAMDEAIGNIVRTLMRKQLYDDTMIFFTTDNGGMPRNQGNNYPLRGGKMTLWEGGTRGVAFVHGSRLLNTGYKYDGLIHAVDWFPTILSVAGITPESSIDGVSVWDAIRSDGQSPRTEFVYNIDSKFPPIAGHAAIRVGDYKLIDGFAGINNKWTKPPEVEVHISSKEGPEYDFTGSELELGDAYKYYQNITGILGYKLYNIRVDPTEHNDLSKTLPDKVEELKARLEYYKKREVPADFPKDDEKADPKNFGGAWSPGWC